ncbi:hypothetical protein [Actinophytocola sp.]|uniref:hypothetical protein n=1 Tax=Actinophytocola sp. TaxID=1872138 RepID=UPI002D80C83A|nr:hypothetical protein [Actinophytocola sp.]HET9140119.1 hypothetical protein [Actinophytocola sp.]
MTDSDTRYRDNPSWQRSELRPGGRYAGRDYFDRRLTEPGEDLPNPIPAPPGTAGRAVKVVGLVLLATGFAAWLWLLLALVSAIGSGVLPNDPFGIRITGIPLGSGGLIAILVGGTIAVVGSGMERTAQRRIRWEPVDPA